MRLVSRIHIKFGIQGAIITLTVKLDIIARIEDGIILALYSDSYLLAAMKQLNPARIYRGGTIATDRKTGLQQIIISKAINAILRQGELEVLLVEVNPLVAIGLGMGQQWQHPPPK